jgi:hypothetical protein
LSSSRSSTPPSGARCGWRWCRPLAWTSAWKPEYANKVDGRAGVILFAVTDVQEPVADVARALATYAGSRFVSGVSDQIGPGI